MSKIEQKSDKLLLDAVLRKASDIHIIPTKQGSKIQLKIENQLFLHEKMDVSEAQKLISHFKFRSKMDIGEKRRPQNGSLHIQINAEAIDLRLSTLPTLPHESLAIRILPQNKVTTLEQLTLFKKPIFQLRTLIKKAHGLLLISGPTGSGKTTTIFSLLHDPNLSNRRIITIEDPVEKRSDQFIQVEINERAGLTYSEALKATLRHDPDIIMIGEIRDEKTAQIAIRAAMTGHLVISTIHANNSAGCISRLREFGIPHLDMKETIIGLVSQRLLSLSCPICKGECSVYCHYNERRRRVAIFEIVAEQELEKLIRGDENNAKYETLGKLINKCIALGYIPSSEHERWLC